MSMIETQNSKVADTKIPEIIPVTDTTIMEMEVEITAETITVTTVMVEETIKEIDEINITETRAIIKEIATTIIIIEVTTTIAKIAKVKEVDLNLIKEGNSLRKADSLNIPIQSQEEDRLHNYIIR
jgi:hypothetical protein